MDQQRTGLTFETVFAEYEDRIYRYLFRLANGDAAAAEDVAQETWIRVYASLATVHDPRALGGWLYTVARREWLRAHRSPLKTIAMSSHPASEEIADHAAGLSAERQINHLALQQCLARLAEAQREALILVKMEEFSHREAAAILGRPEGTVKFQVAQALRNLRKMLVDDGALAAAAPLGLLEASLSQWGDQTAPPTLPGRIRAALAAGAAGSAPAFEPLPGPGQRASRAVGRAALRLPLSSRARWITAIVGASLLSFAALRLPRGKATAPALYPDLLLREAEASHTVHATGTFENFIAAPNGRATSLPRAVEYWYVPPAQYRRELRRGGAAGGDQIELLVMTGGKLERRLIQPTRGRIRAMPDAGVTSGVVWPLAFADPGSRLCSVLREQRARLNTVPVEDAATPLRRLMADQTEARTLNRWSLDLQPFSGKVVSLELVRYGVGALGPQLIERVRLERVEYDVPTQGDLFTLPAAKEPRR